MAVNVSWLQNKSHTLHCHLQGAWTVDDIRTLVQMYHTKTVQHNQPFDVILTADAASHPLPPAAVTMPVHPLQQTLIVVNAHTFFTQLTDVLRFSPSACMTVFAGSWNEAAHFADGAA
jgi:hypothetical protein